MVNHAVMAGGGESKWEKSEGSREHIKAPCSLWALPVRLSSDPTPWRYYTLSSGTVACGISHPSSHIRTCKLHVRRNVRKNIMWCGNNNNNNTSNTDFFPSKPFELLISEPVWTNRRVSLIQIHWGIIFLNNFVSFAVFIFIVFFFPLLCVYIHLQTLEMPSASSADGFFDHSGTICMETDRTLKEEG